MDGAQFASKISVIFLGFCAPTMLIHTRSKLAFAISATLLAFSGNALATTLFSDDFQTNNLATKWAGPEYSCSQGTSASIVSDPLVSGGHALAFGMGNCASDIVTTNMFSSVTGTFIISFDYMHVGSGSGFGTGGGFLGWGNGSSINQWLEMDSPAYGAPQPSNQWTHITASFSSSSPVNIAIEQWSGQSNTAGSALYKNLVLTDGNGPSPVASAPEPASITLMCMGLLGFAASRRKKSA